MAAEPNEAPYLRRIRLTSPKQTVESATHEQASEQEPTTKVDDWDKDDFPSWYQDKVDDGQRDKAEAAADQTVASSSTDYALDLAAVRTLDQLSFGPVTVLAGDNGSGKSTIIEAIAVAAGFNPEGGSRNLNFSTHNTHSDLADRITLEWEQHPRWGWFLRAETFYGMASHIEADEYLAPTFPEFHSRSHGESFLDLATHRFTGAGLYLLDEPESALSIQGLMALSVLIAKSLAKGSQFIISTHSPLLMAFPDARVFELDATNGFKSATFDSLQSTALWQRFFQDPTGFHQSLRS